MIYRVDLWDHQKEAIATCKNKNAFALLWEMGTGKTAGAVNILRQWYTDSGGVLPTIIICPTSVRHNWAKEIKVHAGTRMVEGVRVIDGNTTKKKVDQIKKHRLGAKIFIINTESLQNPISWAELKAEIGPVDCVVVDESHKFKAPNSKRTKALHKLRDEAKYRLILSGSPQLQGPEDYWAQFMFLDGDIFPKKFWTFQQKYFYDENAKWKNTSTKKKWFPKYKLFQESEIEISKKLSKISSRKSKADCLTLPPFVRQEVLVDLTPEQRRIYKDLKRTFIAEIDQKKIVTDLALEKAMRLAQVCCGICEVGMKGDRETQTIAETKTKALIEMLEDNQIPKAVVWAHWRAQHPIIEKALEDAGIPFVQVHGGITGKDRDKAIYDFQYDKKVRVFLATQASAGTGTDGLQVANYEFYLSKNHKLEDDLQSEARIYRGGSEQHEKVTRVDIDCIGTIEQSITAALQAKSNSADMFYKLIEDLRNE